MPQQMRRGVCLVISAPSGAGKSTIAQALRQQNPHLFTSVSVTTRSPRPGEEEGVHYYFRTLEAFREMAQKGELVEWAEVFGRGYGTPRAPVEAALEEGRDIILDIDWQGYRFMKQALPKDVVGLFVLPPSLDELERRLRGRASDSEEEITKRMRASVSEMSHWHEFEHVLINENFEKAVDEARSVLEAARLTTARRTDIAASLAPLLEKTTNNL